MDSKKVAIVGGGITGLTAAFYLKRDIERLGLSYEVKLIEASDRLGGKIKTVHRDGFILERGPDSFLERKTPAVNLVEQLGISEELVRNSTGQARVLVGDTLHPIPSGSYMGIPVREDALDEETVISEEGKKRVKEELHLPKGEAKIDQSLGHFLRARFGDELIENLVEPLLSGIYSSDVDIMSLMASFPAFYELEQQYGSVIKGLRETLPVGQASTGKRKGQFLSFQNGLETLVDSLFEKLGKETVMFNTTVEKVTKKDELYRLHLNNDESYTADAVIMTIPHSYLPTIFEKNSLFEPFKKIPMSSVANVVLAFDESAIKDSLDGTGFVVSRKSPLHMTACTWTHRKWPSTTPDGKALLRTYVGKPSDQEVLKLSDNELVNIVRTELQETMGITKKPEFTMVTRWQNMMPQYTIGHAETLKNVRNEMAKQFPGISIAGSSFDGIGLPDCIGQGETAATQTLEFLK